MNILHLLSQNQLTGAEVYACTLIENQVSQSHRVFQISNEFFYPSLAQKTKLAVETKSKLTFLKNIFFLRTFIKENSINVIHSHSRASAKLAFYATLCTRCAHVSTIHGTQHSSISKRFINQYGQLAIAVCEEIRQQLIEDFKYGADNIRVLPNPIMISHFSSKESERKDGSDVFTIGIVGRMTGPKGERTRLSLNSLIPLLNKKLKVHIVGASIGDVEVEEDKKEFILYTRHAGLDGKFYKQFDLVIGSGRVAAEAALSGVPVIGFGEACYEGLLTTKNLKQQLKTNFGDILRGQKYPKLEASQLQNDVRFLIELKSNDSLPASRDFFNRLRELTKSLEEIFQSQKVSQKVERIYESAFFLKNYSKWIPILMYHKIPAKPLESKHKIFVTQANFEKHLKFFRFLGFQTLTFKEIGEFRKGLRNFNEFPSKPLILTFDDGYCDNLDNAAPLLEKYGFNAQLFLLADPTISSNKWDLDGSEPQHDIVSGEMRKQWLKTPFEIGSHGFGHRPLTSFSEREALLELSESKLALTKEFGKSPNVFAFTYGTTTEKSEELAESAGYEYAVNTDSGGLRIEERPYAIFRVSVFPHENYWTLWRKTSSWYRSYYRRTRKK